MRQEVNLHQPMFRKQRTLFSARATLRIAAIVVAAMGVVYFIALGRTQLQAGELRRLEQQRETAQRRLEQASTLLTGRGGESEALAAEVARLTEEFNRKSATLQVLSRGGLGTTDGFAGHFAGLARQRLNGLWLTRVEISSGGEHLSLEGEALAEELIPRYLRLLSRESQFTGVEFQQAVLQRAGGAGDALHFELHTRAGTGRP